MRAMRLICILCGLSAAGGVAFGVVRAQGSLGQGAVATASAPDAAVSAAQEAGAQGDGNPGNGPAPLAAPAPQSVLVTEAGEGTPTLPLASMASPAMPDTDIVPLSAIESDAALSLPEGAAQLDATQGTETDTTLQGQAPLEARISPMPAPLYIPDASVTALAPASSLRPQLRDAWAVPEARWDNHPSGARWTSAVLSALRGPGAALIDSEPRDIGAWCPGYLEASPAQRAAFWTGLISALAWHESTHQPRAVGGGGLWYGLVQIAPPTAEWRNCDVETGEALLNGAANLRCGIRIMAITVPRDNVVSEGFRGVAADWGPFHSSRKREDMRNWVRNQSYCQAPIAPMRPVMRPAGLGEAAMRHSSVGPGPEVTFEPPTRGAFRPVPRP